MTTLTIGRSQPASRTSSVLHLVVSTSAGSSPLHLHSLSAKEPSLAPLLSPFRLRVAFSRSESSHAVTTLTSTRHPTFPVIHVYYMHVTAPCLLFCTYYFCQLRLIAAVLYHSTISRSCKHSRASSWNLQCRPDTPFTSSMPGPPVYQPLTVPIDRSLKKNKMKKIGTSLVVSPSSRLLITSLDRLQLIT